MKKHCLFVLICLFLNLLFSCKSNPYAAIDNAVLNGDYTDAIALHEKTKKKLYNNKSVILYQLDSGMLHHYAGNHSDSIERLQEGERKIEEAYTKSVTELIGTIFINNKSKTYPGESYEDVYTNAFNALNYYRLGKLESATVETRRMSLKLMQLNDRYESFAAALEEKDRNLPKTKRALKSTKDFGVTLTLKKYLYRTVLNDSVMGRYLGMLFYREADNPDSVRIDYEYLENIFANAKRVFPHSIPASVKEELNLRKIDTRLNVIGFAGLSPIIGEERKQLKIDNDVTINYSVPILVKRPSEVSRLELVFEDGKIYKMELLEDIAAVQAELMKYKLDTILKQTNARLMAKAMPSAIAYKVGKSLTESGPTAVVGLWMYIGGGIGLIYTGASEKADTRSTHYFPGKTYIAGLTLNPGIYSFTINYYNTAGTILRSVPFDNVKVEQGKLNIVEAVCLK